jgi:hypothetical protein
MKFNKTKKILSNIFLLLVFILAFTSCYGSLFSYVGATVDAQNRISLLEKGPHQGQWSTRDLSVDYLYNWDKKDIKLSGVVQFNKHLEYNFTMIDHFSLWIHFIDEEGKILENRVIAVAGYRKMLQNLSFEHNLKLPLKATGITFSYDGRAREGGGADRGIEGGGTSWDFWKVPHS